MTQEGKAMKIRCVLVLLLIIALLSVFASCGGSPLIERYVIVDIMDDPDGTTLADLAVMYKEAAQSLEEHMYMEFLEGNKFTVVMFGEEEAAGTYTRKGKMLTLTADGETTTAVVSGSRVTWTYKNGAKLVFEKK